MNKKMILIIAIAVLAIAAILYFSFCKNKPSSGMYLNKALGIYKGNTPEAEEARAYLVANGWTVEPQPMGLTSTWSATKQGATNTNPLF